MAQSSSVPRIRTDLAFFGRVTQVISNTQFVAAGLAGLGDGALVGYAAYVLVKADGTITAPHAEQPAVSAYVTASGTFTHVAYTATLTVGDQLLLLHPNVSSAVTGVATLLTRLSAVRAGYLDELDFDLQGTLVTIAAYIDTEVAAIKTQTDKLAGAAPGVGTATENWQTAEADIVSIGANDTSNKLHSLVLNISALTAAATITIRMYMQVNGVEREVYSQDFVVGTDPDGLWIVNGTIGIHEVLRVTAQSDTVADNGLDIEYDHMLEAM